MAHCWTSRWMQFYEYASKFFSSEMDAFFFFFVNFKHDLLLIELASFPQLSQSPMDKRPSYNYIQGANVTPTTFYNIGDFEVQDNLARIWCGINCIFLPCSFLVTQSNVI